MDEDGEIAWFIPIIYFAVYAAIEYGTQVYQNYQASKNMKEKGIDPMSGKDIWFGQIDWFDVVFNGVGGAVSSCVPAAAPWIMYGSPWITNSVNLYGDGRTQTIFDGSIPLEQYFINTGIEVGSMYATNVIKTGLATDTKDIWNPDKHTKYFSKETKGRIIELRSLEDMAQQAISSTISYTAKSTYYLEFNRDRLFIDGIPVYPEDFNFSYPHIPTSNIPSYKNSINTMKPYSLRNKEDMENDFKNKIFSVLSLQK